MQPGPQSRQRSDSSGNGSKILLLAGLLVSLGLAAGVTGAQAAELALVVTEIREDRGSLRIELLDSEAAFDGDARPLAALVIPARTPEVTVSVQPLDPGSYGIRVFHDLNDNETLDTNLVGMPIEPWGFSNDAAGRFGAPTWKQLRFVLDPGAEPQRLKLNH